MGLFKRVGDNVRANISAMLDKIENPEKLLNQYIQDMETEIKEAQIVCRDHGTSLNLLKRKVKNALFQMDSLQIAAENALKAGNEEDARRALVLKRSHGKSHIELTNQVYISENVYSDLLTKLNDMNLALAEMKTHRDTLVSRLNVAEAYKQVSETSSNIGKDKAQQGFARIESKIVATECQVEATMDLDSRINRFSSAQTDYNVDNELKSLKEHLGLVTAEENGS